MKLSRHVLVASLAVAGLASIVSAAEAPPTARRARISRVPLRGADPKAAGAVTTSSYSVEVPYVQSFAPADGGQGNTLVLNAAHSFNVTLVATDQHNGNVTGPGVALPQTDTFGYFSLPSLTSNPSNPEVFVKILDGRPLNGAFWVFYGHLTDLIYDLTVVENATGATHTYHKDAGNEPGGFDTTTFVAPSSLGAPTTKATQLLTPNAFLRTSVDISNNTSTDGVNAVVQYCYSSAGAFVGCTQQRTISLQHFANFHQDDIVGYLGSLGDLPQSAVADSSGTLLVTFSNLPSQQGWEGTVAANTYNRVSEVDPTRGTVGCGQQVSLFFQSATGSLVGTARNTTAGARSAEAGSISSTLGIHNTDAMGTGDTVTVDVTLYDPSSGLPVGNALTLSDLAPGELRFIDDLFNAAAVTGVTSAIVFVDTRNATTNAATVEGFILDQDTDSLDTRYHEMSCASGCF
ncbi:MAG TPA: hypothetical protein VN032_06340 [Thermoanaerobaculia bacterium]|jgi:hypothetical protein|nr:hypothetical protein [Thermoanaerobaculia bacterium]